MWKKPSHIRLRRSRDRRSDSFGIVREHPGIVTTLNPKLGLHILNGSVAVEGAEPGDMLEIRVERIELRQNWGASTIKIWLPVPKYTLRSGRKACSSLWSTAAPMPRLAPVTRTFLPVSLGSGHRDPAILSRRRPKKKNTQFVCQHFVQAAAWSAHRFPTRAVLI